MSTDKEVNELQQTINRMTDQCSAIINRDISFNDQLGKANGFHDVNDQLNEVASFIKELLFEIQTVFEYLSPMYLATELPKLQQLLDKAWKAHQATAKLGGNQNQNQFQQQRSSIHKQAENLLNGYQNQFGNLINNITFSKATARVHEMSSENLTARLDHLINDIEDKRQAETKKVESLTKEAVSIIESLRTQAAETSYKKSESSYLDLSGNHKVREWSWFVALCASILLLGAAAAYIIWGEYSAENTHQAIILIFRKVFMVSVPLLLLKISLTKYNAERHLRIVYDHRTAALDQLILFEAAIGDNTPAKAELRLEAAKMILSDPNTPYATSNESSEVNINPIFSAIEKGINTAT